MKVSKFIMAASLICGAVSPAFSNDNSENIIINTRDIFNHITAFKVPNSFVAEPGNAYEDATWYIFNKKTPDGKIAETITIRASKGNAIPKNHDTFVQDMVVQATNSCSTTFSSYDLPEMNVLGVESNAAVIKCGETGGWRRQVRSLILSLRTFEKDGVFYELSWAKYGTPDHWPLTEDDKKQAIEELKLITPYASCINDPKYPDLFKFCIKNNLESKCD